MELVRGVRPRIGESSISHVKAFDASYDALIRYKDKDAFTVKFNEFEVRDLGLDPELFFRNFIGMARDKGFDYVRLDSDHDFSKIFVFYKEGTSERKIAHLAATMTDEITDYAIVAYA